MTNAWPATPYGVIQKQIHSFSQKYGSMCGFYQSSICIIFCRVFWPFEMDSFEIVLKEPESKLAGRFFSITKKFFTKYRVSD